MSEEQQVSEAPERAWIKLLSNGDLAAYRTDIRASHHDGRPVFEFVPAQPLTTTEEADGNDKFERLWSACGAALFKVDEMSANYWFLKGFYFETLNKPESPQPPTPSSAEVAREIVERFAAEVRREGFKGAMYEAIESLMDEFDGRGDDPAIDELCQLMSPLLTPFIDTAALRGAERLERERNEALGQCTELHRQIADATVRAPWEAGYTEFIPTAGDPVRSVKELMAHVAERQREVDAQTFQKRLFDECVTASWDPEKRNTFAEEIAHLHEELSEAFRAWRRYKDCGIREVNGKLEGVPVEFADVLIGLFYNAELHGFDLFAAVEQKHQFNLKRNYVAEGRQLHAPAAIRNSLRR